MKIPVFVRIILAILLISLSACNAGSTGSNRTPLVVFAAGSLIIPFGQMESAFEAAHPEIDVQAEYHGSIQVIRHATELHEPIDVIATADASLVPMLMYAVEDPNTGVPYANWFIRFASNRLAIGYHPGSLYADEINGDNWMEILSRPDVMVGFADPRIDPSGYRTLMAYKYGTDHYQQPTAFMDMFADQMTYSFGFFPEGDLTTITVPKIVETTADSHIIIRGASIQLIALLQSGDLDYAFEYESVIRQHDLDMVDLPDAVDLGAEDVDYSGVVISLDTQRFATVDPLFRGERIGYGITIPSNAPNPEAAAEFIAFLFGPEGRAIMDANYHPVFDPPLADSYDNVPDLLQDLCQPGSP